MVLFSFLGLGTALCQEIHTKPQICIYSLKSEKPSTPYLNMYVFMLYIYIYGFIKQQQLSRYFTHNNNGDVAAMSQCLYFFVFVVGKVPIEN